MGKLNGPYNAEYSTGTKVRIASRDRLLDFYRTWRYHDKLDPVQFDYAGAIAEVASVGFYHGGEELYQLTEVPGIWHAVCLELIDVA